jgi:FkbM family methyltransferase
VKLDVTPADGPPIDFECADTVVSAWINREILEGKAYPALPFVTDVQVAFDVGANCGAASVQFARRFPDAQVHAFEPGRDSLELLRRNVAGYANVSVHPIGLHSVDQDVPLYHGDGETVLASVFRRDVNRDDYEMVRLRAAGAWCAEHGIDRIDVLKVDVEGCEADVLESLAPLLPTVKVCYLEYDSRRARRVIDSLFDATHELYYGLFMFLDQGECIYVRSDLADQAAAHLPQLLPMAPR